MKPWMKYLLIMLIEPLLVFLFWLWYTNRHMQKLLDTWEAWNPSLIDAVNKAAREAKEKKDVRGPGNPA